MANSPEPRLTAALQEFLAREQLPDSYAIDARRWFQPLAEQLLVLQQRHSGTLIVGVQGAQGTGKSTLAALLAMLLQQHGQTVAQLSLDDFYLGRSQRQQLAADVHPLLATRGVPGTHDVDLAMATMDALCQADNGQQVALPRFDKANDDRRPVRQWPSLQAPVDVIILEGWCLGAGPQAEPALAQPINRLERERDANGDWRRFVNQQLAGSYRALFARLDFLVVLQAPSFDCVYRWRGLQEQKLAAQGGGSRLMDRAQLEEFIAHYERLTRLCLDTLPALAQRVYQLDDDHRVLAETSQS